LSKIILTKHDLQEFQKNINKNDIIVFDLETENLDFKSDIFCISFLSGNNTFYLPFETINKWRKKPKKIKSSKKKMSESTKLGWIKRKANDNRY